MTSTRPAVLLVHGAFADGSSWPEVVAELPLWLNLALGVGAGLAATERVLRLRYAPLLDGAGA